MGAGGASEDAAASGEERPASASEEARLRSGSGKAEEDEDEDAEPGRRRVSASAVSSKSRPEAAEDSVELRSVSTDMAGGVGGGPAAAAPRVGERDGRGWGGRTEEEGKGNRIGYSGWAVVAGQWPGCAEFSA